MVEGKVKINRAPVLTLWASVVAERMGYERPAALSLGKAVAGLNAQAKGRSLGIYHKAEAGEGAKLPTRARPSRGEEFWVTVCGRPVPVKKTRDGVRAVVGDEAIEPEGVERYLRGKFGEHLEESRALMARLASAYSPTELEQVAFSLYEAFRPEVARGKSGWGQAGTLDLAKIRRMSARKCR